MKAISVIIPTYKSPECLDLCLKSAIEGQTIENEIIVVVDGHYDLNKDVLEKYKDKIKILNLEENVGTCRATNLGVFNATNDYILILNDDNVFPDKWNQYLGNFENRNNFIYTPNQIEPYESIFKAFVIKDLGITPKDFKYDEFKELCEKILEDNEKNNLKNIRFDDGYTFPIVMKKIDFLRIGGFDESYPSQSGFVADWEFFIKAELNGFLFCRDYALNFYHFVSATAKSPESIEQSRIAEQDCHNYFKYKWGFSAYNRLLTPKK